MGPENLFVFLMSSQVIVPQALRTNLRKTLCGMVTMANFEYLVLYARHFAQQLKSVISFNLYKKLIGCHLFPLKCTALGSHKPEDWPKP